MDAASSCEWPAPTLSRPKSHDRDIFQPSPSRLPITAQIIHTLCLAAISYLRATVKPK